jgi:hypothetical protein
MKRISSLILFGLFCIFLVGCGTNESSVTPPGNGNISTPNVSANSDSSPPPAAISNANVTKGAEAIGPGMIPQGVLQGTYAISEVQHDGLAEIISSENTTEITFIPPATFSRTSKKGGKVNHSDSGEYDIFGNNTLILKIMMSRQQIQPNPVVKRHAFALSTDGNEFRLTSEKGRVAVFRRIKPAPEPK